MHLNLGRRTFSEFERISISEGTCIQKRLRNKTIVVIEENSNSHRGSWRRLRPRARILQTRSRAHRARKRVRVRLVLLLNNNNNIIIIIDINNKGRNLSRLMRRRTRIWTTRMPSIWPNLSPAVRMSINVSPRISISATKINAIIIVITTAVFKKTLLLQVRRQRWCTRWRRG